MRRLSTVRLATQADAPREHDVWCVDRRDAKYLFRQIFDLNAYGGHGVQLSAGDVIVDVGANIGMFLLYVTQRLESMTYYAMEPIPAIFEALQKNAVQIRQPIHCVPLGLAAREGEATFDYLPRTPCCSTMYPADQGDDRERARSFTEQMIHQTVGPWLSRWIQRMPKVSQRLLVGRVMAYYGRSQPVKCQVTTLSHVIDKYQIERIDLLKIDAERAELDILRGIEPRHWPIIRQMILEVHYPRGPRYDQLVELLEVHGCRITQDGNPTNEDSQMFFVTRA